MAIFLIDANLPINCPPWQDDSFIHVIAVNPAWSDEEIWNYAHKNSLTIITKDADFSNRILFSDPPPKVIHIKVGNMRLYQFNRFIENNWTKIEQLSDSNKLVNVFLTKIETID